MHEQLAALPDSHDAFLGFARTLDARPLLADWPYDEPDSWEDIVAACDPLPLPVAVPARDASAKAEAAFLASVCGCILGKPVEVDPSLDDLRTALEARNEWPLDHYFSGNLILPGKALHADAGETCRENIRYVAPDDDINYTILGMLNLEQHGEVFSHEQLRRLWVRHISPAMTWGPERAIATRSALWHWTDSHGGSGEMDAAEWTRLFNPHGELCGALIRADAYGYACAGDPARAAALAWRDASFTHRRTSVYAAMFAAAAIAAAFNSGDRMEIFATALRCVPQRTRFYQIASDSLAEVSAASDWLDGYRRLHGKYRQYSHCRVYQECGTLINTLRFAENTGHGICLQVMQGNDTDSFGATAGSILGAWFGPGHLDPRWTAPFQDDIRTGLAFFYERSLATLAQRIGRLPERFCPTVV